MRSIIHDIRKLVGTREAAPSSYKKLEKCNQPTFRNGSLSNCLAKRNC
ncbi:hypothetical protein WN944_020334 [Citrus x changshan-huyou]|uniref:Uncharacterized protein n=1 Tax=Citrus x changshan-huyou TaxID=2935761 RepID=A0AAP0QH74_9ROSI